MSTLEVVVKPSGLARNTVIGTHIACMERASESSEPNCLQLLEWCPQPRILTWSAVRHFMEECTPDLD